MKVILFTQEGCNKCDLLKAQLVKKKIDFEEVTDVNTMVSLGLTKTPALKVGDEILDYNKAVEWVFKQ